ncbi:MAG: class I SAM-dependent methyltransferase [Cytophagales bacterium]
MSFAFHHDKPRYFNDQYLNSKNHVIPFIEQSLKVKAGLKVLEIGCAEGGVLKAFTDLGCICTGVELSASKVENANIFMKEEIEKQLVKFVCKNIYELDFKAEFAHQFDLIVLKDTIEHIPDQERIIGYLKYLLKKEGHIFFGFPPWHMPWGGHQQICKSKFLMFLPYFHLLPMAMYKQFLRFFGEKESHIEMLAEIKETGITSTRFEQIITKCHFSIRSSRFYLVNPIYYYKFKWKPRFQLKLIEDMGFLRDWVSTTVYYLVKC